MRASAVRRPAATRPRLWACLVTAAALLASAVGPAIARAVPANDLFANATPLAGSPVSDVANDTQGATKEPGEPDHAGQPGGTSVWWAWTAPSAGKFRVTGCSFDETLLAVYTGGSLGSLTPVASDAGGGGPCSPGPTSTVVLNAQAGTTYRIAADGPAVARGYVALSIDPVPFNDDLADAGVLGSSLPTSLTGTTRGAGAEDGEPVHSPFSGGHSVWYSWTASGSGPVTLEMCPGTSVPTIRPVIGVYTGTSPAASHRRADGARTGPLHPRHDGDLRCRHGADLPHRRRQRTLRHGWRVRAVAQSGASERQLRLRSGTGLPGDRRRNESWRDGGDGGA